MSLASRVSVLRGVLLKVAYSFISRISEFVRRFKSWPILVVKCCLLTSIGQLFIKLSAAFQIWKLVLLLDSWTEERRWLNWLAVVYGFASLVVRNIMDSVRYLNTQAIMSIHFLKQGWMENQQRNNQVLLSSIKAVN